MRTNVAILDVYKRQPLMSDILVRMGMNGILVLAMVPAILSGIGLNFGLPLGVLCGLLGALTAIELDLSGFAAVSYTHLDVYKRQL